MRVYGPVAPGVFRLTLSALVVTLLVAAVWRWETDDWWWVGAAVVALIALLGSWRGIHLSGIVRRRSALTLRNRRSRRGAGVHGGGSATDVRTTVLVQVEGGRDDGLRLPVIAGYLDRYGIRCSTIRVTTLDPQGITWIGLTLSAAENLPALLARSEQVPLHQTAHVVQRRLADHLRELGCTVHLVDADEIPWPTVVKEQWRSAQVDGGYLAAYRVRVDQVMADTVARIRAFPAVRTWTALELTGDPRQPAVSVSAALLTAEKPGAGPPIEGLTPHAGDHGPALRALRPTSTEPLDGQPCPVGALLGRLRWPPGDSRFADGIDDAAASFIPPAGHIVGAARAQT